MSFLMNFLIVITLFIFTTKLKNVIANPVENFRNSDVKLRIAEGQIAKFGQFPFMAALGSRDEKNNPTICGGALISRNAVLTSVGCVKGRTNITVVLGARNLSRTANEPKKQTFLCNSSYFITHPNYNSFRMKPNLAIIKLPTPAKLDEFVTVIHLPTDETDDYNTKYATVFGWGQTSQENRLIDMETLRYAGNYIMTNAACQKSDVLMLAVVDDTMVCLSGSKGAKNGVCKGDMGSPLVYLKEKLLIGVLAFHNKECGAKHPSAYTRTNKYLHWIHQNMH